MSGTEHLRLFIQERLTAAAEEIFGVLEKTISEYEVQVVQSKQEVEQLKQDMMIRHLNTVRPHIRTDSQPVSEELLPLQHLNPGQEPMSSKDDEAVQHQSPQVIKEEQVDLGNIPGCKTNIYNRGANGLVESQTTSDNQLIPSYTYETFQQCPQVKEEEQVDLGTIPQSERSIFNSGTNEFITSGSTSDSQPVPPYTKKTVQQRPQVKGKQADLGVIPVSDTSSDRHLIPSYRLAVQQSRRARAEPMDHLGIIPDSETGIYNIVTNGFTMSESTSDSQLIPYTSNTLQHCPQVKVIPDSVTSESTSDSHPIPCYTTETATTSQDVAVSCNESDESRLTLGQKNVPVDIYSMEQKICRFCRMQFRSFTDVKRHVEESHIGERAFKCPECHKEFARRDRFSIHYRIHTGEKRHLCPVCGKSFIQRSNCMIHMRTHTSVKTHSCPVCRKLFANSTSLRHHIRIHTGVKPYSCNVCGKAFNQNSNLKVHIMRAHRDRGAGTGEVVGGNNISGGGFVG